MVNQQLLQFLQQAGNDSAGELRIQCSDRSILELNHVAVVCSRLGRSAQLHRHIGKVLASSAMRCREQRSRWLVARKSAIAPWISRASELFRVPITWLAINEPADMMVQYDGTLPRDDAVCRDSVVVFLADQVEAAYVRRGGMIEASLERRLRCEDRTSIQVAVTPSRRCAGKSLIQLGAIGRYWQSDEVVDDSGSKIRVADEDWTRTRGEWLIHCTRACQQNWPDETMQQYRDALLIGERDAMNRGPWDALTRILRSGRLVASATASHRKQPVVCFSALPLQQLLTKRCFRPHLGRWDYEPFGIAVRLKAAQKIGIRPVIYGEPCQRSELPKAEQYRFHPVGTTVDWREENEWRSCRNVNLREFHPSDVRVFAAMEQSVLRDRIPNVPWRVTSGLIDANDHQKEGSHVKSSKN